MCVGGSMLDPHDTSAAEIQDGGALSMGNEARWMPTHELH